MKLIRLPEVLERVALKKTAVYKLMAEEEFPRPVKLGSASAWVEAEIEEWISERMTARPATSSMLASS
jgi:prophage regulatory protein